MVNDQREGWRPIHDNHAIAVMAAVVSFAQPIPDLLLRKLLRASEEVAFAAGLKSRQSIRGWQLAVGAEGISQSGPAAGVQGQMFNALMETPEGSPTSAQIGEQLQVDQNAVIYRTWSYVSWAWQRKRMLELMSPALTGLAGTVAIARVRLEYLDRFSFRGDTASADPKLLLRAGSPLVAPHVFARSDLFHSHTGAFVSSGNRWKRLQQVMIDALDLPDPPVDGVASVRWINITTALEDRLIQLPPDDGELGVESLFRTLDDMHTSLKDVLGSVITDDLINRIYLRARLQ